MVSDDRRWMEEAAVPIPDDFLYTPEIESLPGPWVAVSGYLRLGHKAINREVWGFVTALLVSSDDAEVLVEALKTRTYPGRSWLPTVPKSIYTFAGEIPWSESFASDADANSYQGSISVGNGVQIQAEILAHEYAWERYHSILNQASGALVPSRKFSSRFQLKGRPQSFDQDSPDGCRAAISLSAPEGLDGHMLYLREDLVYRYAAGRRMIWFVWGEKERYPDSLVSPPDWYLKVRSEYSNVWRHVRTGEELSRAFGREGQRPRGKTQR